MFWALFAIILIVCLAIAFRKATKGTPFKSNCGCTPNIDHLRWVEKGEKPEKHEQRW